MPHRVIRARTAYHLNLTGLWNPLTWLLRRWRADDEVWPAVVQGAADFIMDQREGAVNR